MREGRCERLWESLAEEGVDALLVSTPENRRYLSGFTGSSGWLLVEPGGVALLTDGRYWDQVERECPGVELVRFQAATHRTLLGCLNERLASSGWRGTLGVEGQHLPAATFLELQAGLPAGIEARPVSGLVERLRQVKSPEEIEAIRRAAEVADAAFRAALGSFQEGVTEADFCAELEYRLQKGGARKPAFDSIVASGPNGAFPHAGVTRRPIRPGELVTVDFGAVVDGYCSDVTRTIWLGDLDDTSQRVYQTVRAAQQAAQRGVRAGRPAGEVDALARDLIAQAGYGEFFTHSLGHGLGLAVHEAPGLRAGVKAPLLRGMVVTVEPGIYLPGVGGCRVEELVVVTEGEPICLTRAAHQEIGQIHPLEAWGEP